MTNCSRCGNALPPGFPGATVTCTCGESATLAAAPSSGAKSSASSSQAAPSGGPYRAPSPGVSEIVGGQTQCPFCGNGCPPLVRVCPHCDVRLDNVRCVRCYSLQPPGSFSCGRCGQSLELEPLLDATDAPCPRCKTPLEAAASGAQQEKDDPNDPTRGDERVQECPRCGGMFVPKDALAEILCQAELAGPFAESRLSSAPPPLEEVKYVQCPLCHVSMNRVNFGKLSGVIVDVCRKHGTWFDAGELTRAVAFAANGGLQKAKAREAADQEAEMKELALKKALLPLHVASTRERYEMEEQMRTWERFLRNIFFW